MREEKGKAMNPEETKEENRKIEREEDERKGQK